MLIFGWLPVTAIIMPVGSAMLIKTVTSEAPCLVIIARRVAPIRTALRLLFVLVRAMQLQGVGSRTKGLGAESAD